MNPIPKKILVVRNDKLGDFMLAFYALALLKNNLPDTEIHVLVPSYTREIAEASEFINHVITDPGQHASTRDQLTLLQEIRRQDYDAVLTLFSTTRIGLITWLARIPIRLAPATKIAQLFYNKRLKQNRSRSEKPEHAYNTDLALTLLQYFSIESPTQPTIPFLHFPDNTISTLREDFCRTHGINSNDLLIFIHAGSGGSANNLSLEQFAHLARDLKSHKGHTIVISAGPSDRDTAHKFSNLLQDIPHVIYESDQGLRRFAEHIQFADLFISGSTGPLHIAGALDRPTAGFYTRRQSATALRWQTLNSETNRLSFSPPEDAEAEDMSKVNIDGAVVEISKTFFER